MYYCGNHLSMLAYEFGGNAFDPFLSYLGDRQADKQTHGQRQKHHRPLHSAKAAGNCAGHADSMVQIVGFVLELP